MIDKYPNITLRRSDGLEVTIRIQDETPEYWYGRPTHNAISSNYLKSEWTVIVATFDPLTTELARLIGLAEANLREYQDELRRKDEDGGEWYWLSSADRLATFIINHRAEIIDRLTASKGNQ